jgi:hypothetical protein
VIVDLRKKSATIMCSANGSSAPTATVMRISILLPSRSHLRVSKRPTNRFPRIQRFKPLRPPIFFPPCPLLLDVVE